MKLHYAILSLLTSSQIVLANPKGEETAYFAGGCFWCMEQAFEEIEGVTQAVSGYMNGHKKDPTYKEVSVGITGHTEEAQYSAHWPATILLFAIAIRQRRGR